MGGVGNLYGGSSTTSTTIKPEHMEEWERLARAGMLQHYEYDPAVGYVPLPSALQAAKPGPVRRQRPRPAPAPEPTGPRHGSITMYLMGDRCDACLAAGERYRANGGTWEPVALP